MTVELSTRSAAVKIAYEANPDTNALTDALLAAIAANTAKVSNATHTGDVTGSGALTIADDAVTYAKIQNVVNNDRVLGRVSGANGAVEELTAAQVYALIKPLVVLPIAGACSDEMTDLTTGTAKLTFIVPYSGGFTLTGVIASVTTAPTGSALIVDINEGGVSVLSTKISIDASETDSTTAATPPVISDSGLAGYAKITVDIDQVGSVVAGTGLKVYLIGYPT